MYAEAKIELNQIDDEVLACINDVRARAYKVKRSETAAYPAITVTDQAALRRIVRRERRVELAWENHRYFDLQRWHQFENAFAHNRYGFSRDAKVNKKQNYAIVDGGIHQLVYYGQSMAMKHPYCHVLPEKQEGETMDWNLFGSLCTVNDILVKQMPIRNLTVGDVIVFENTGAYSTTEGIALFLSRDLPKILLRKEDGEIHVLRDSIDTDPLNTPNYHE